MKNLTEKRKKKEKYSYLIAFNLKGVDQTMGSNEDQMFHSPPSSDALQSARLVRLFGRISKQTASSTTAVLLELIGRTRGVLGRWKKGEHRRAGRWGRGRTCTRPCFPSWLQYMVLTTCVCVII